jgi:ankyrin repeat protein
MLHDITYLEDTLQKSPNLEIANSLIIEAVTTGNLEAVKTLIQYKSPLKATDDEGNNPFIIASGNNDIPIMRCLYNLNIFDLEATNNHKRTAFIQAAKNGAYNAVQFLYYLGADINAKDSYNNTGFMYALSNKDTKMIHLISDIIFDHINNYTD